MSSSAGERNLSADYRKRESFDELRERFIRPSRTPTLIPKIACIDLKNLKYLKFEGGKYGREVGLIYRETHHKKQLIKEIGGIILASLNQKN